MIDINVLKKLLKEGNEVKSTEFKRVSSMINDKVLAYSHWVDSRKFTNWISKTISYLEQNLDSDSYYLEQMKKNIDSNKLSNFDEKMSLLESLIESIEDGIFGNPTEELKNNVYSNTQPIKNQNLKDKSRNNNFIDDKRVEDSLCFVLMPFDEKFDGVYDLIKEDLDNFKLNIKRADDIYGPGIVIKSIFDNIQKSKFLIADLTGCNANVFYELGYAAALDKKVILITQDEFNNMPFDVLGWRTIQYSDSIKGFKHLKKELNSYIENL
ncbi:hypothetical protein [Methanobrevibacter arboriphilus]|uniref:hypothetical protein n=1 Tax=Methanobrevibacter arboriphilus TaxID=39441 RepID=UPI00069355E8|nr:hypothetical protein [Methanobrevibacter arboriphilus]